MRGQPFSKRIFFPFANFLLLLRVAFSPLQKHYSSTLCPPFPLPAASAPLSAPPSLSLALTAPALISRQLWLQHQASLFIVLLLVQTPQSPPRELAALLMILDHTMPRMPARGGQSLRADEKIHCEQVAPSLFLPLRGTGFAPGSSSLCLWASAGGKGCSAPPPQPSLSPLPPTVQPRLTWVNILSPALSSPLFFSQSFAQLASPGDGSRGRNAPSPPPVSGSLAFCAASSWLDGEAGERAGGVTEAGEGGRAETWPAPSLAP